MKRLARLALATSLTLVVLLGLSHRQAALATPFSDVPANHWAYQYIQSLAADGLIEGYPNGQFLGNRPLTRYEMAVMVARVVAKLQDNSNLASKDDLAKLQKLVDALKDELDALGVRVTNLEDSLDALNKKTAFAQSLWMHGTFLPNLSLRQRNIQSTTVAHSGADSLSSDFIYSDASDEFYTPFGSGVRIRQDDKFTLGYNVSPNLTVSFPVRILTYDWGGAYGTNADNAIGFNPAFDVNVKQAGAISNLTMRFGTLDNYTSSRTGLAFRAPFGSQGLPLYDNPMQPDPIGFSISGTVDGSTDFRFSYARLAMTMLQTVDPLIDPSDSSQDGYLVPFLPNQYGYNINSPSNPSGANTATTANQTDVFGPTTTPLSSVYLTKVAVAGTLYISSYNGVSYNPNGTCVTAGCYPPSPPSFAYDSSLNSVIFGSPIPVGSTIKITYTGESSGTNENVQRYMITGRINHRFTGWSGAEIGLTFNRIFDFDDLTANNGLTSTYAVSPSPSGATQPLSFGYGLVSDTVFGLDAQAPLPFDISGKTSLPTLFGEVADSKYTNDYVHTPATNDTAGVFGLKLKIQKVDASVQFQSVGLNYLDGADVQYLGNPPALLANWHSAFIPDFMGLSNTLALNQQYAGQPGVTPGSTAATLATATTSTAANYTFAYPAFNPFHGVGPFFFQAFAPNTRGVTVSLNAPIQFGGSSGTTVTGRLQYQHLSEIIPNSFMASVFGCPEGASQSGCAYASNVLMYDDNVTGGASFGVPVLGTKVGLNLTGSWDRIQRLDTSTQPYYPFALDNNYGQVDVANPTAGVSAINTTGGVITGSPAVSAVRWYPNYVDVAHYTYVAAASVPINSTLTFNATYNTQRYGGSYAPAANGSVPGQNMSQRKDYMDGSFTYAIPKTNSSVSFVARNYRYTDYVVPSYDTNYNRQDINFTVRF
ncbi:MAG TPA: S-layer homology domain-containing protein [Candidatus Acidoferrales bacterium]|nr:S-layer homology domain-containing protein [Candidatus Acidoferrales bacterium]